MSSAIAYLDAYVGREGQPAVTKKIWPKNSKLVRHSGVPKFLLFLDPDCPCSVASVHELERLLPATDGKIDTEAVIFEPAFGPKKKSPNELSQLVRSIPQISLTTDEKGSEIDLFGVRTSGQAILYDADGFLVFAGGLTPARGHEGDSDGRAALLKFIAESDSQRLSSFSFSAVFGCSIKNPERARQD